jgi:hypothetical protein
MLRIAGQQVVEVIFEGATRAELFAVELAFLAATGTPEILTDAST